MSDYIELSEMRIPTNIGVGEEERSTSQVIELSVVLFPQYTLFGAGDQISQVIDYFKVYQSIVKEVQRRSRALIETLNEDVLRMLIREYPLSRVSSSTSKQILPNMKKVTIEMTLLKDALD